MGAIRHNSPVPVYVQLADLLAERIRAGEIRPDYPLPSEASIQQEYGVSRNTARRAVSLLRQRGLVYTVTGRGSYAREPSSDL